MAYFAGAGTVIAAIAGGVGGGLLIADMVSPKSPKPGAEQTRLERRMSPEPIAAANAPSEPVQYLEASQLPASTPVPAQPQTQANNSASTPSQPVDTAAAPQPAAQAPQPAAPAAQPVAHEQTAAADDAVARARDADSRRAAEKRRAERNQQWADKRRHQQRQEQELQGVEERVRGETEPRQEFMPEPERVEMPRIRLFGVE
jgi:type IV secretory pathway VirB10-like protein